MPRELAVKDFVWKETIVEGATDLDQEIPRYVAKPVPPPSAASSLVSGFPTVVEGLIDWYRDIVVLACQETNGVWSVDKAIDVTSFMHGGRLQWKCPAGKWTILRIGYVVQPFTDLGYRRVQLASWPTPSWEIDPMSAEAMDLQFAETAKKMIEDAGPLTGKTLKIHAHRQLGNRCAHLDQQFHL